ncbi:MAG: hypothetical protein AAFX79_13910, partial [Planctomycetota bacterium]
MPLQGALGWRYPHQAARPLDMLDHVLAEERELPVVATLHPKWRYAPWERAALRRRLAREPRLTLSEEPMERLLPRAAYVVAETSAVAFLGFFLGKPAVLFGAIDFHHIAANVRELGVTEAFRQVRETRPDFDRYVAWFLQDHALNTGAPDLEARIL